MQTSFEAVLTADEFQHVPAGEAYPLPGGRGGVYKQAAGAAFNVRSLRLEPDQKTVAGDLLAGQVMLPAGLIVIESNAVAPIAGQRIKITIEVLPPA